LTVAVGLIIAWRVAYVRSQTEHSVT
jgi:hypothetical protein